jgi:hypothetical protein
MPRPTRPDEKSRRPQEGATPGDPPGLSEVEREEQAARAEMAQLGLVSVDPATLEKGPPLSQDDWQALFRFYRDPGSMSDEKKLRIIGLTRRYDTWHRADNEVVEQWSREVGRDDNQRN